VNAGAPERALFFSYLVSIFIVPPLKNMLEFSKLSREVGRMNIGFLITRDAYADKIAAIAKAAIGRGHTVSIFMTDDGVKLIRDSAFTGLRDKVDMSLCDFSARNRELTEKDIPEGVTAGTQYQNSLMHNECDKVLIF
jgi:predicted peroxiredoxin